MSRILCVFLLIGMYGLAVSSPFVYAFEDENVAIQTMEKSSLGLDVLLNLIYGLLCQRKPSPPLVAYIDIEESNGVDPEVIIGFICREISRLLRRGAQPPKSNKPSKEFEWAD